MKELKAEKALSQMKNETRSMLNESGLENFDDQIVNILVNTDAEKQGKMLNHLLTYLIKW